MISPYAISLLFLSPYNSLSCYFYRASCESQWIRGLLSTHSQSSGLIIISPLQNILASRYTVTVFLLPITAGDTHKLLLI